MAVFATFWFLAFIGVGTGWCVTHYTLTTVPRALKAKIAVPKVLLTSKKLWHSTFCKPAPGHTCALMETKDLDMQWVRSFFNDRELRLLRQRIVTLVAELEGLALMDEWRQVEFICCAAVDEDPRGIVVAQGPDVYMTVEPHKNYPLKYAVSITNKRHCLAPPILPFGRVLSSTNRHKASWPDHYHVWLPMGFFGAKNLEANEVAIWDRSVVPYRATVNYDIIRTLVEKYSPLPVYYFDEDALRLARIANGTPRDTDRADLLPSELSPRLLQLQAAVDVLTDKFDQLTEMHKSDTSVHDLAHTMETRHSSLSVRIEALEQNIAETRLPQRDQLIQTVISSVFERVVTEDEDLTLNVPTAFIRKLAAHIMESRAILPWLTDDLRNLPQTDPNVNAFVSALAERLRCTSELEVTDIPQT